MVHTCDYGTRRTLNSSTHKDFASSAVSPPVRATTADGCLRVPQKGGLRSRAVAWVFWDPSSQQRVNHGADGRKSSVHWSFAGAKGKAFFVMLQESLGLWNIWVLVGTAPSTRRGSWRCLWATGQQPPCGWLAEAFRTGSVGRGPAIAQAGSGT